MLIVFGPHLLLFKKKKKEEDKKKVFITQKIFSAELFKVCNFIRLIYVAKFHDLYMFYFMNWPDTLTLFRLFPGPQMPLPLEPSDNSTQSFLAPAQVNLCRKDFLYLWNYLSFAFCTITYLHPHFILLVFC